ncbi:putative beta-glucuronidase [Paramyrothecium foliicola]|nr:putative beta-glucuronidase [Paramyrothecium foliicola]
MLEAFSERKLTYETDRLAAIEGLANAYQNEYGDVYRFGVFNMCIVSQLLWTLVEEAMDSDILLDVPSWSWASKGKKKKIFWVSSGNLHREASVSFAEATVLAASGWMAECEAIEVEYDETHEPDDPLHSRVLDMVINRQASMYHQIRRTGQPLKNLGVAFFDIQDQRFNRPLYVLFLGEERTLPWVLLSYQLIAPVNALPKDRLDDQVQAEIDAGTFQNPSVHVRPRFRYWIPDASADLEWVQDDVKEIGRIGASGLELLGFYLYGGPPLGWGDFAPVDWSVYGWGTKAWQKLLKTFAQATKDNGLIMDFAMGPNQGQGVPAPYNDDGKAWDLAVHETRFAANATSFNGIIKGWGTGPVEAVILAGSPKGGSAKTLAVNTLQDVTYLVQEDGQLEVDLPETDEYNYVLFSVYLIHSHFMAQNSPPMMKGPQTKPETWVQNGSWAVDHYSAGGAKLAAKFWEEHLLTDGVLELIKEVGNYAWEDSIEIRQKARWTKGFLERFKDDHKYELQRFLPVAALGYNTDQWDEGERYRMDYRSSVANAYGEFLQEWTRWANERLNVQYSHQVSYGMWMDMLQNIPKVNAPETESLIYESIVDKYRQYTGPANLAGKRIISIELGAEIYNAFQQTLPELFDIFQRSVAGGVNQAVIHGTPYSGGYPNTTWPGMMTFGYQFADCHNRHQPAWEDYRLYMDAMGRLQQILQTGVPRRDALFWMKRFWFPGNASYVKTDLTDSGYTYEYLSPENFNLHTAVVENGVFAPARQQFKVMIVRILDFMTVPGVRKLLEYAKAGLPIIFEGGIPTRMWNAHQCAATIVNRTMHEIAELDNVHVISEEAGLANTIASLGIEPLTRVSANGTWYTVWREDTKNKIDYVWVYNENPSLTTGTVDFASTKIPYYYDIWTGTQTPVVLYEKEDTRTIIPFTLHGNQSTIIAFLSESQGELPDVHLTAIPEEVASASYQKDTIRLKAGASVKSLEVVASDGKTHKVEHADAAPFELNDWELTVEHWDPPKDMNDAHITALKSNTTHKLSKLVSWSHIDGLEYVSGRGYYETKFDWPLESSSADGAFIDVGRIVQTLTLSVNGQPLPPLDPSHGRADIGPYLKNGENQVNIVIATTMINVLRPIWYDMRFSGTIPEPEDRVPPSQDYGLKGPILVTPYRETLIWSSL